MEGEKKYPHMCGGVLASILLEHKRDISPQGVVDPLGKVNFIRDLARVVKPGFEYSTDGDPNSLISYYVNSRRKTSSVLPFAKESFITSFRRQMEESYPLLLYRMDIFLKKYVDTTDSDECGIIVKEIYSIAAHDADCRSSWLFILPNGEKSGLGKLTEIHFQPFILGIWYYIISHRTTNVVDKEVFDEWNSSHSKMKLPGEVILDMVPLVEDEELEEFRVEDEAVEDKDEIMEDPVIMDVPEVAEAVKDQTLISHNGRIYNQHAEKIVNIEHVDVLNI